MKILLISGHPRKESFLNALTEEYLKGAQSAGHEVKSFYLSEKSFNPILEKGYKQRQELEPDLKEAQELIKWSDHIVVAYPVWWANFPALLKGFFDRVILPGFGFYFLENSNWRWQKMLKGKSCRVIVTTGSPLIYYKWILRDPAYKALKGTLSFCGIKPIKKSYFGWIENSDEKNREKMLRKIYKKGEKEKHHKPLFNPF